jgi:hypothetical protein
MKKKQVSGGPLRRPMISTPPQPAREQQVPRSTWAGTQGLVGPGSRDGGVRFDTRAHLARAARRPRGEG